LAHEEIKEALIEIIGDGSRRGRKWFFPKNVDNKYKVFANMTVKELAVYGIPSVALSVGIGFIPPYDSVTWWIIKGLLIALIIVSVVVYVNYRPVKGRDNIRTKDYIKELIEYRHKQKIYYTRPKERFEIWDVKNNE